MAGITLEIAQAKLTLWLNAEETVAASQSYEIENVDGSRRKLTRADLKEIAERIRYWSNKVNSLTMVAQGTSRSRVIVN